MSNQHETSPFNELTPAESEALSLLAEECAEVIQAITKIQRHGPDSFNPDNRAAGDNGEQLAKEIGQVFAAVRILRKNFELDYEHVKRSEQNKMRNVRQWLHHARS